MSISNLDLSATASAIDVVGFAGAEYLRRPCRHRGRGGLYTWAFEREVGRWSAGVADRLLRLIGVSAVLLAAFTWPAYAIWVTYLHASTFRSGPAMESSIAT